MWHCKLAAIGGVAAWLLRELAARLFRGCAPFPACREDVNPLQRGLKMAELPRRADAIVIGAGPSGLALAVLLGRRGKRVLVVEQHDRVGGGLHTFNDHGFEFDTGFHYCGELNDGKELRKIVANLTGKRVGWAKLEDCALLPGVYDTVQFPSAKDANVTITFDVPAGRRDFFDKLAKHFPDESSALKEYEVSYCTLPDWVAVNNRVCCL